CCCFFMDNDPTAIYTLSLHDALPISSTNEFNGKVFCFYKDGSRIYSMPVVQDYNDSCRPPLNIKNIKSVALNIYTNPTSNIFHRSEEHTSELQSRENLVCRLLLEKKK